MTAFYDKAMLATLTISAWSARKYDKKISQEVADSHNTSVDVGRYNKVLIAKDRLSTLYKIITKGRIYHCENTMPWDNSGTRLFPVENYFEFQKGFHDIVSEFEPAADEFAANYPSYIEESERRLNSLFIAEDYPDPSTIRSKFAMKISIMAVPRAEDFRVELNDEEVSRIRKEITETVQSRMEAASNDLWKRLYDTVSHMHQRLSAYSQGDTKRLHASIIGNLSELTSMLTRLNFTDDKDLERMRQEIETKLLTHGDIGALKHSESARIEQTAAAKAILDKMASYMGDPS